MIRADQHELIQKLADLQKLSPVIRFGQGWFASSCSLIPLC